VEPLRHGYTNRTVRLPADQVEKLFEGPDRFERWATERACVAALAPFLPVPGLVGLDRHAPSLRLREAPGRHGQDLLDAGRRSEVLRLAGEVLRHLQALSPSAVPELAGSGPVIVHGDFGPQNLLIHQGYVSALFDWEFAHVGQPVEDLAWAEWIVRMHHPTAHDALGDLLQASDLSFGWSERHTAMVDRCRQLLVVCERNRRPGTVQLWRHRLHQTEQWAE
jgi:aminoglycoside phosphotransferase